MTNPTRKLNPPKPGSQTWGFRVGDEVKDKISGVVGTVMSREYHVSGCDTFSVEAPPDPSTGEIKTRGVIGQRLELVTSHPERHIDEIPDNDVCLGDQVKDLSNDAIGTVIVLSVPLYGTTQVAIEPAWNSRDKKMGESWIVDTHWVEVIKPFNPPSPAPKASTPPPTVQETVQERVELPTPRRGSMRMPASRTIINRGK